MSSEGGVQETMSDARHEAYSSQRVLQPNLEFPSHFCGGTLSSRMLASLPLRSQGDRMRVGMLSDSIYLDADCSQWQVSSILN